MQSRKPQLGGVRVSYASVKVHKRASQKSLEGIVLVGVRVRVPRPKIERRRTTARVLGSDHQHHVHVYQGHDMPQFR